MLHAKKGYYNFIIKQPNMATFKLTNINLQIDRPLFQSKTTKILKIEVAEVNTTPSIIKLAQPAQLLNAQSLQWH
jgi:hypothetical protein